MASKITENNASTALKIANIVQYVSLTLETGHGRVKIGENVLALQSRIEYAYTNHC